jgi:hypothetical protein
MAPEGGREWWWRRFHTLSRPDNWPLPKRVRSLSRPHDGRLIIPRSTALSLKPVQTGIAERPAPPTSSFNRPCNGTQTSHIGEVRGRPITHWRLPRLGQFFLPGSRNSPTLRDAAVVGHHLYISDGLDSSAAGMRAPIAGYTAAKGFNILDLPYA